MHLYVGCIYTGYMGYRRSLQCSGSTGIIFLDGLLPLHTNTVDSIYLSIQVLTFLVPTRNESRA